MTDNHSQEKYNPIMKYRIFHDLAFKWLLRIISQD